MTVHTKSHTVIMEGKVLLLLAAVLISASACAVGPLHATNSGSTSSTPISKSSQEPLAQSDNAQCDTTLFSESAKVVATECFLDDQTASPRQPGSVVIPVYFHIIMNSAGEGDIPDQVLQAQINVLNEAFAGRSSTNAAATAFRFFLADKNRKVNDEWFDMVFENKPAKAELDAKKDLHQGDKSSLNIYTVNLTGALGWARWPWQYADGVDGVVVSFSVLPGGTRTYRNLGDVIVHEVGHWLGLFHPSERECNPPGDCVDDTPAAAGRNLHCETGNNNCPTRGTDPHENFMNDTYDYCKYKFTADQATRMDAIHRKYRS